ncbi:MetQ/NlpA family ABC transporter substrate-binding protein [Candidatus Phytoplasma solani]|uniref:MetQ/NlpA family ABC transporter substrate-binding protein n=1 Tax=Candidatus Phytoplasma solani TaxID=69896 RepID=UPI00358E851C
MLIFSKTKKNLLLILFIISIFVNLILSYFCYQFKTQTPVNNDSFPSKIKIATALPTVQSFLEGSVKNYLKEYHNIDLEVNYLPLKFEKTDELLANKEVDAKFDAHVHHLNIANKRLNDKLTFVQAGYLAKFGLFAKQDSNLGSLGKLKQFKIDKPTQKIKIFMSDDNFQRSLSLYLLQQLGIIKQKEEITIPPENFFELKPDFFKNTPDYPEIKYETVVDLASIKPSFESEKEPCLCLQYPTLMGNISNLPFGIVGMLAKPASLDDPIYSYTISLVSRKDNENSKIIQILQKVLKQETIIKEAQTGLFKDNYYMIPSQEIDNLSQEIKVKYLGKTHSESRST